MIAIVDYSAGWDTQTNGWFVRIATANNPGNLFPLKINTPEEFIGVLQLLSKQPVGFDPATGRIEIAPRPAGT